MLVDKKLLFVSLSLGDFLWALIALLVPSPFNSKTLRCCNKWNFILNFGGLFFFQVLD